MKKSIVLPLIVSAVVLASLLAINANWGALKQKLTLEQGKRLVAESKLDAAVKTSRHLEDQLADAKKRLEGIQNIVNQGQSTANQLKSTVETTAKENENLKMAIKKLQDDLAASQKAEAQKAAVLATVPADPLGATAN